MRARSILLVAAMLLLSSSAAVAQDRAQPTLKAGDKAPSLGEGRWVKGEPVEEFESGKVYVIEHWATWSGASIEAIPHLSALQKKYEDEGVVVIAQNVWETDPDAVEPLVEKQGEKMGYRVVMDEPSGRGGHVAKTWMAAAGRNSLPCAFIVDQQGEIAWIGNPLAVEPVLKKVLAGDYDPVAEAEKDQRMRELGKELNAARREDDTNEAMRVLDEMAKVRPEMSGELAMVKFDTLRNEGRWDEAYAAAEQAIPAMQDAQALNSLSWRIVDPEDPYPQQNLEVALKAAERANELTRGEDAMILDTLALCCWLSGEKARALELQQKAVDTNESSEFDEQMKARLRQYRQGQARRE